MHPHSPVDARCEGRSGIGQREVLLRRLLLLLIVVSGEGRVGMIRHRRLVLVLVLVLVLIELGVHMVVLGLILEVLQMLPLLVMMVLLRGRRRDSVLLAHDAGAGSLWLVDEGSHHGGGMNWGGGEVWLRVLCVGIGVGERLTFGVRVFARIASAWEFGCAAWARTPLHGQGPRQRGRDTAGQGKGPMIQTSKPS